MRIKIRLQLSSEFWPAFDMLCNFASIRSPTGDVQVAALAMWYFFRTSTRRLCVVVNPKGPLTYYPPALIELHRLRPLLTGQPWASNPPNLRSLAESAPIDELHKLLSFSSVELRGWHHGLLPLTPTLFAMDPNGSYTALARLPPLEYTRKSKKVQTSSVSSWAARQHVTIPVELTLHNDWTRISVGPEVAGQTLGFDAYRWPSSGPIISDVWLSQARHVFSALNIRNDFHSYVIVASTRVDVKFSVPQNVPAGYLFLCPPRRALESKASEKDIAYWSLDPLGHSRLSREEAHIRGFPDPVISRHGHKYRWDALVYEEIRAVHIAKGFDPDSQEVARHLGYPLFELVSDTQARLTLFEDWETNDFSWTLANFFGEKPSETHPPIENIVVLRVLGVLAILFVAVAVWIELSR
ncbi:hypothetical protein C8F01DRAFT_768235 [Mycena amicta]|nr:hypothetical protein C8F01DRAFT_768235 [Mycena amicta]